MRAGSAGDGGAAGEGGRDGRAAAAALAERGAARAALAGGGLAAAQAAGGGPRLWRDGFHRPLLSLRAALGPGSAQGRDGGAGARRAMEALLEDGEAFYRSLLGDLQSSGGGVAAGVPGEPVPLAALPCGAARREAARRMATARTARECQRCLVYLGDLERYRQQHLAAPMDRDFTRAEWFYLQAAYIFHPGGRPHNQLAVLAQRRGRLVVALYRHVRSSSCEEPFPSARRHINVSLESAVTADGTRTPPRSNPKEFMAGFCQTFLGAVREMTVGSGRNFVSSEVVNLLQTHYFPELARTPGPVLQSYLHSITAGTVGGSAASSVLQLTVIALWAADEACRAGGKDPQRASAALLMSWATWLLERTVCATAKKRHGGVGRSCQIPAEGYLLPGLNISLEWLARHKDFMWRWSGYDSKGARRLAELLGSLLSGAGRAPRGNRPPSCRALFEDKELRGCGLTPECCEGRLFGPWRCPSTAEASAEAAAGRSARAARLRGSAEALLAWLLCRARQEAGERASGGKRGRGEEEGAMVGPSHKTPRRDLLPGAAVTGVLLPQVGMSATVGGGVAGWLNADLVAEVGQVWAGTACISGAPDRTQAPAMVSLNPFVRCFKKI